MICLGNALFQSFLTSCNESNSFIVACVETKEALLVDAGAFEKETAAFIHQESLRLTKVFITHNHFDHTDGLAEITKRYNPEIFAGVATVASFATRRVNHGDTISVGRLTGKVLAIPGHTDDSVCLYFPGFLFTGDALFAGSIGGARSDAQRTRLVEHIRKHILSLSPDTEVHPGHGPSSTVAIEKKYNPFLQ